MESVETVTLPGTLANASSNPQLYRQQLKSATAPIQDRLNAVEAMIRRELQSNNPQISEMLTYVSDLGGKRLRPCLLLLAASASGQPTEESIPGRWIADAAKLVCEGEILQGQSVKHFELSVPDYLELLDAKTGALCAVSCSLGAWSGGGDESMCFRMQQYGRKLGTAFQVFDDWLDVWGASEQAGKTLGTDLLSFKPTLPAIRTLEQLPANRRDVLIRRLNAGELSAANELRQEMDACDASEFTKQFARDLVADAIEFLNGLPASTAVEAMRQLAIAAIERNG